jgi:hypothetical protein
MSACPASHERLIERLTLSIADLYRSLPDFSAPRQAPGQTGPDRRLSRGEGGTTGCTALLAVPVSEHRAFFGDTINVRHAVAHDSVVVGTADVVRPK